MAGKENIIADALSPAPAQSTDGSQPFPINACVLAPPSTLSVIIENSKTDAAYTHITDAFKQGKNLNDLPEDHPARRLKQVWG